MASAGASTFDRVIAHPAFGESPARDLAPWLERAFDRVPVESSYLLTEIEGRVPPFVRGSYLLNGPARFRRDSLSYGHWLDGDGMVCRLDFDENGVKFTNRFVDTQKRRDEERVGAPLYRCFGTSFPGDRLLRGIALASPANVNVLPWAGLLLAFGEQGMPWQLDPETLETLGPFDFHRALNPISPFSAHPVVDERSGELFNFGVSFSSRQPMLHFYRFDREARLQGRTRVPLDAPYSVHDFTLSQRHAAIYLSPYLLEVEAMRSGATVLESLSWQPERGSRLLILSRETGEPAACVAIGSSYCLHLINSFEAVHSGREVLVVDLIELERPIYDQYLVPELFLEPRAARPVRYVVDVAAERIVDTERLAYEHLCDFPAIDPRVALRPYEDFWLLGLSASASPGRKFFDELVHCRWQDGSTEIYRSPPGRYLGGEPVFVGDNTDAARGAILCQELDAEKRASSFLVFDAFEVSAGPRARLPLRSPIHLGFHATFDQA